jgi:hypothetical protein
MFEQAPRSRRAAKVCLVTLIPRPSLCTNGTRRRRPFRLAAKRA